MKFSGFSISLFLKNFPFILIFFFFFFPSFRFWGGAFYCIPQHIILLWGTSIFLRFEGAQSSIQSGTCCFVFKGVRSCLALTFCFLFLFPPSVPSQCCIITWPVHSRLSHTMRQRTYVLSKLPLDRIQTRKCRLQLASARLVLLWYCTYMMYISCDITLCHPMSPYVTLHAHWPLLRLSQHAVFTVLSDYRQ